MHEQIYYPSTPKNTHLQPQYIISSQQNPFDRQHYNYKQQHNNDYDPNPNNLNLTVNHTGFDQRSLSLTKPPNYITSRVNTPRNRMNINMPSINNKEYQGFDIFQNPQDSPPQYPVEKQKSEKLQRNQHIRSSQGSQNGQRNMDDSNDWTFSQKNQFKQQKLELINKRPNYKKTQRETKQQQKIEQQNLSEDLIKEKNNFLSCLSNLRELRIREFGLIENMPIDQKFSFNYELVQWQITIKSFKKQLKTNKYAEERVVQLQQEIEKHETTIQQLQQQVGSQKNEFEHLLAEKNVLLFKLDETHQKQLIAEQKVSLRDSEYEKQRKQIESQNQGFNDQQKHLEQYKIMEQEFKEFKQETLSNQQQLENLKNKFLKQTEEFNNQSNQNEELRYKYKQILGQFQQINEENTNLKQELEKRLTILQDENLQQKNQIKKLNDNITDLKQQKNYLEEFKELQQLYSILTDKFQSLQSAANQLHTENTQYQDQKNQLKIEIQQQQNNQDAQNKNFTTFIEKQKQELIQQNSENKNFTTIIERQKQELIQQNSEILILKKDLFTQNEIQKELEETIRQSKRKIQGQIATDRKGSEYSNNEKKGIFYQQEIQNLKIRENFLNIENQKLKLQIMQQNEQLQTQNQEKRQDSKILEMQHARQIIINLSKSSNNKSGKENIVVESSMEHLDSELDENEQNIQQQQQIMNNKN